MRVVDGKADVDPVRFGPVGAAPCQLPQVDAAGAVHVGKVQNRRARHRLAGTAAALVLQRQNIVGLMFLLDCRILAAVNDGGNRTESLGFEQRSSVPVRGFAIQHENPNSRRFHYRHRSCG